MPAQLTGTNGSDARALAAQIARATVSLPDPLSPVINTLASDRAIRSISAFSSAMAGLDPIIWTEPFCSMGRTIVIVQHPGEPRGGRKKNGDSAAELCKQTTTCQV